MRDMCRGSTLAHEGYGVRNFPATGIEPTWVAVGGYGYRGSEHVRVPSSFPGISAMVVDEDERRLVDAGRTYRQCRKPEP